MSESTILAGFRVGGRDSMIISKKIPRLAGAGQGWLGFHILPLRLLISRPSP